jgi:hypothetical protein
MQTQSTYPDDDNVGRRWVETGEVEELASMKTDLVIQNDLDNLD